MFSRCGRAIVFMSHRGWVCNAQDLYMTKPVKNPVGMGDGLKKSHPQNWQLMAARGGEESVFLRDVAPDGLSHTPVANLDPCAHAQHDLDSVSSKRVLEVGSGAW